MAENKNRSIGTRSLPFKLREIDEDNRTVTLSFKLRKNRIQDMVETEIL